MPRSRHCGRHQHRLTRYGEPTAVPIKFDRDVHRHYHAFVKEGMARYANHKAMQAGLQLADELLRYTPSDPQAAFTFETECAHAVAMLVDHGVQPAHLLARIAELVCFFEDHPERVPSQRVEDFALARGVLTLVPWKVRFNPGAKLLKHLGPLVRARLYPWALAFVRKLKRDVADRAELMRTSATFD